MHELSIANAILDVARRNVPPGCSLKRVRVIAGPMRAIEPLAMQFAWDSVIAVEASPDIEMDLRQLPWRLRCPVCGNEWTDQELRLECACGCTRAFPVGGDELSVDAIEVDGAENGEGHEYLGGGKRSKAER
jgi:Zn finger protein HypA/HybF involved in hydrogenase expression